MKKYLYILSQRYSGSTLLSFLLATHPEVSTIGERRKFYNKVIRYGDFPHHNAKHCSCGKLFGECDYLTDVKNQLLSKIDNRWLRTNATELKIYDNKYLNKIAYEIHKTILKTGISPFKNTVREHQKVNEELVSTILKKDNTSVFLDSSKIINQALYLSQIPQFDFHVIWLIRDPRAQINSAMKHHSWSIEKATSMWLKEMVNNERILAQFDIKHIKLSYSELCLNTESEMKRIFNFVNVNPENFSLDFRDQDHHIMGNYMRLQKDQKIVERKEWKKSLTSDQIEYINKKTIDYEEYYS